MKRTIRTYSEMLHLGSFIERFRYLQLKGRVGEETFGFERYLNQRLYHSAEWYSLRDYVIARDLGRDLAGEGYEIHGRIYIHHMNPILPEDFRSSIGDALDPEFLICTTFDTHNAIHYGDPSLLTGEPVIRKPNDTCPWKR